MSAGATPPTNPPAPLRPVRREGLPGAAVPAVYKLEPEDFEVEELPLYEPSGAGDHSWAWIQKRGIGTMPAVERLARALGRRARDFGYAGLKDAQAVARQWISLEHADDAALRGLDLDGVAVLEVRRHTNKLKLGHLRGNRFRIVVRGAGADAAHAAAARQNLAHLARHGVPNWFGEQRFGKRGANLQKGLRILHGNPRKAARSVPKHLLRLLVSAVQSEVFNRVLAQRLRALDRLLPGDVAWLHHNGACFLVEDPRHEQHRCDAFEISPSGPLPGPKMLRPTGPAAAIEDAALRAVGVDSAVFGSVPGRANAGARRPLRVPLTEPDAAATDDGLVLRFALPRGSYATAVLHELLTDPP